jgi:hypothetical protein
MKSRFGASEEKQFLSGMKMVLKYDRKHIAAMLRQATWELEGLKGKERKDWQAFIKGIRQGLASLKKHGL